MKILLIISGSIAAYKALDFIRKVQEKDYHVTSVITNSASHFITPLSISALSGNPVYTNADTFTVNNNIINDNMKHIDLSRENDVIIVAPASANIIAKVAYGMADELASTILLAAEIPVVIAPAMNVVMWQSRPVQRNIEILKSDGKIIVEPQEGSMACGEYGKGKMATVDNIIECLESISDIFHRKKSTL